MFNVIPTRYLFDHTSLVLVGGLGCVQPAAKIKGRQWKNEEESERDVGGDGDVRLICVRTCATHWMNLIIHT